MYVKTVQINKKIIDLFLTPSQFCNFALYEIFSSPIGLSCMYKGSASIPLLWFEPWAENRSLFEETVFQDGFF
jgi:hypothetical protein